jgi:hypothetical protein
VEPSALHKTIKAMSPRRSLAQSHRSTMPTSLHRQGPTWATMPPTSSSSRQENSARHDKACSTPHWQATRLHRHRQGPIWATRPSTSPSSCRDNSARHVEPARHPHRQPTRLTTTANNDNADSTSQMSKSRRTMQEMHNSTVSPPALARRPIHTLMNRDASHLTSDGRNDHSPHQVGSQQWLLRTTPRECPATPVLRWLRGSLHSRPTVSCKGGPVDSLPGSLRTRPLLT